MKRPLAIACLLVAALAQGASPAVHASTTTPPPLIPPWCDTLCQAGPPPPPSPVPKAPPPTPAPPVFSVRLAPIHVHRGRTAKLEVNASVGALVSATVRYARAKPVLYKGKIDSAGVYTKSWKVPTSAPLGKASVKIELEGLGESTMVDFVVIK